MKSNEENRSISVKKELIVRLYVYMVKNEFSLTFGLRWASRKARCSWDSVTHRDVKTGLKGL